MDVALYGRIKSPHAEVRGRRPSLEARTGSAALHRQGCVLRGSRSLAPQDEGLGGWSGRANFRARQLALCPYEVRNEKICPSRQRPDRPRDVAASLGAGAAHRLLLDPRGAVPARRRGLRAPDRHQGRDGPQEHRRDLCAAQSRGREPARRRMVGRPRRSASAGRRRRAARRIQIADARRAARLGGAPRRAGALAHRRHLSRRARHRLQHQGRWPSAACPSRNAGPTSSIRASRTRSRSRTRTPPAPPMCSSPRSSSSWARTRRSST